MEKALRNLANPMEVNVTNIKHKKGCDVNEDSLKDKKKDQRDFVRKDHANQFTPTFVLTNDNDGKITEREMSLPSAFFSRKGLEDSRQALLDLSDTSSEDAQVNHRANRSVTVSEPLGSDRSIGSESETDKDNTILLGDCATEDLDLVENAILRLLREDGRSLSKTHNEDSTKLKDTLGVDERLEGSDQTQLSVGSVDLQLLSSLLNQVQTLREQKYQHRQVGRAARSSSRGKSIWDVTKRGGKEKRITKDDMKKAMEAATQAAKSATEAARNASSMVTKNSEVVGKLLQSLNPSTSKAATPKKQENKTSSDDPEHFESSSDSEGSNDSDDVKAIAKRIVSQNRCTHVVLGIMLVSSFVWRYIVVKVVKRVTNKVSDPWGYVGGMLTDNFKGPKKEKEKENADSAGDEHSSGLSMPQLNLPPLLNGERRQGKEFSTFDHIKEENILSFGNIMHSKLNNK